MEPLVKPQTAPRAITLLTDFGSGSSYVAQMKGVILAALPSATIVDFSHEIEPQNILEAAIYWMEAVPAYGAATVHVAVVDPGVGTSRRILLLELEQGGLLLAPDNGIAAPLIELHRARSLFSVENVALFRASISSTFHGRDIFAPVAAYLAAGGEPSSVGPVVETYEPLELRSPTVEMLDQRCTITGEVLVVDRFGNLMTNITRDLFSQFGAAPQLALSSAEVILGATSIGAIGRTYGDVEQGEVLALFDSQGRLEIAVRGGSAARRFGAATGARVRVVLDPPRA